MVGAGVAAVLVGILVGVAELGLNGVGAGGLTGGAIGELTGDVAWGLIVAAGG